VSRPGPIQRTVVAVYLTAATGMALTGFVVMLLGLALLAYGAPN